MPAPTCPFLGQLNDPDTALHFPAEENSCQNARPVGAVDLQHQRDFCLTDAHATCPVYQRSALAPLPAGIAAPALAAKGLPARLTALSAVLLVAMFSLLYLDGLTQAAVRQMGQSLAGFVPVTGAESLLSERAPAPEEPALAFALPSPSPTAAADTVCMQPPGWQAHVMNPTDSLRMLSQVYAVPVEHLRQANCLSATGVVLPGEVIFVPPAPTAVPSPTPTTAPTRAAILYAPPAAVDVNSSQQDGGGQSGEPEGDAPDLTVATQAPAPTHSPPPQNTPDHPAGDEDDGDDDRGRGNDGDDDGGDEENEGDGDDDDANGGRGGDGGDDNDDDDDDDNDDDNDEDDDDDDDKDDDDDDDDDD